jgi:hypothetical protein
MELDASGLICLLLSVPLVFFWLRCVRGYLKVGKMFKTPRTWPLATIPLSSAILTYLSVAIFLITGDRNMWIAFTAFGILATLPFVLSNIESYRTSRRIKK